MIKINLLQSGAQSGGGVTIEGAGGGGGFSLGSGGGGSQSALAKLILLFGGAIAFFIYDMQNVSNLKTQLAQVSAQHREVSQKLAKLNSKNIDLKKMNQQIKGNDEVLDEVDNKIAERLTELKALDHIQSVVPEKLWLERLTFKEGKLILNGYSSTPKELDLFVSELESNKSLFRDIVIVKTRDKKVKSRNLQEFEVSCNLGEGSSS